MPEPVLIKEIHGVKLKPPHDRCSQVTAEAERRDSPKLSLGSSAPEAHTAEGSRHLPITLQLREK